MEQQEEVLMPLPVTVEELNAFVESLTTEYNLPIGDDTYDMVATAIMHLPQTSYHMPRSYFGKYVLKSLANRAAYVKLREFAEKREAFAKAQEEAKKAELTLVPSEANVIGSEPLQNA